MLRVLQIGPAAASATSRGGMATVMTIIMGHPDPRITCKAIATYVDAGTAQRLAVGVSGMIRSTLSLALGRFDILHVHLAKRGSFVRKALPVLAARAVGVPVVVHSHSPDFLVWFQQLSPVLQQLVRRTLQVDKWIVLGSSFARDYAPALGIDRGDMDVLINPVDLELAPTYDSGVRSGRIHVLSLGRLGRRKGSYDLVDAIAGMDRGLRERLHVTIAGDGEVEGVGDAVARAGLQDVITLPGWIGPAEREQLLADSSIFILPSYGEGLPMALMEALAAGKAVIITPVGGVPDVITDEVNGLLIPAGSPAAIATALGRLVEDADLRRRLGRAGRETAEIYSLDAWYAHLTDVWTSLVDQRRARGRHRPALHWRAPAHRP